MNIWIQLLGILVGALVTLGLAWIKGYYDNIKINKKIDDKDIAQTEELKKQVKFIVDEIKGMSNIVADMQTDLLHHINETNFVRDIRDSIRSKSKQFLYSSMGMAQKYKSILGYWAEVIEKFGVDYYENKNRKKDYTILEKELQQDLNRDLDDFNNYIDDLVLEYKVIKGKKYRFSKYLEEFKVHNKTHVLVSRLIENGFDTTEKITGVFVKYIDDFFTNFATAISIWEASEDYNYDQEKAA
jgi:hypothetical protein